MDIADLKCKFTEINVAFSKAVKDHIADYGGDAETKHVLSDIASAALDAIGDTQDAIIEYLRKQ